MKVIINNKPEELKKSQTITDTLAEINFTSLNGTAVAVNNKVIPKVEWPDYTLNENDHVTIIRATQGG